MPLEPVDRNKINLGINLRGMTAGINLTPGQAQDALDVLPRDDGGIYRHWGWDRRNLTSLAGRPVGIKLFTYKGKNAGTPGNVREGNHGIADDAALGQFSRRQALYTGGIVLTTTTFYFWRPDTEVFEIQALPAAPAGIAVDLNPKPSFVVVNDNVYIFGWANRNLRYDPTDRALYALGWDDLPVVIAPALNAAASTLIVGAVYQYAAAWWNIYTGEVGPMGTIAALTPTAALPSINFAAGAFAAYAGDRHWVNAGTDEDVGLVVYRTEPDGEAFYFLDRVEPGLAAATLLDDGLATAKSEKALRSDIADEPRFNAADLYGDIIYAISWNNGYNRIQYNNWKNTNSYHERWSVLDVSNLPTKHGEALTAITHTPRSLLVLSQQRGFLGSVTMSRSGRISVRWQALPWTVGAVGPRAVCNAGPWVYFLSERGPYRWREGLTEPQWIGRDLLPLFIDPTSGLCKLNPWSKNQSELCYDQDANVMRWIFPCGGASFPNVHMMYWIHDHIPDLEPAAGWFFASPSVQAMDWGNALSGLNADGTPANPFEVKPRLIFGDALGYVNEYAVGLNRGGLAPLVNATGIALEAATVAALVTLGPLPNVGDGIAGMMVEVVYTDGTIDVRLVAANDGTTIIPDVNFSQDPTGGTWYIGGIPSFWRGVPEHLSDPYAHKSVVNVAAKISRLVPATGARVIDMSMQSGDYPVTYRKTEEVDMALYHDKTIPNMSGRFIQVEFANSRPDGMFCVVGYKWWVQGAETRERDA